MLATFLVGDEFSARGEAARSSTTTTRSRPATRRCRRASRASWRRRSAIREAALRLLPRRVPDRPRRTAHGNVARRHPRRVVRRHVDGARGRLRRPARLRRRPALRAAAAGATGRGCASASSCAAAARGRHDARRRRPIACSTAACCVIHHRGEELRIVAGQAVWRPRRRPRPSCCHARPDGAGGASGCGGSATCRAARPAVRLRDRRPRDLAGRAPARLDVLDHHPRREPEARRADRHGLRHERVALPSGARRTGSGPARSPPGRATAAPTRGG